MSTTAVAKRNCVPVSAYPSFCTCVRKNGRSSDRLPPTGAPIRERTYECLRMLYDTEKNGFEFAVHRLTTTTTAVYHQER